MITRKGQITIPVELRQALDIHEGDRVLFHIEGNHIVARLAKDVVSELRGIARRKSDTSRSMESIIAEENEIIAEGWSGESPRSEEH